MGENNKTFVLAFFFHFGRVRKGKTGEERKKGEKKRLISGVQADLGLHEGVTEQ